MTCSLYSYIIKCITNNNEYIKNKSINPSVKTSFWLQEFVNNRNKFLDMEDYLNNKDTFLYLPDDYMNLMCCIQQTYFAIIKLKQLVKLKYYKKYDYSYDLIGNELKELKNKHRITIIENNTVYNFSLKDLINNIHHSIVSSDNFFWEPKEPKNPYTNLPLSKHNLYNIYFAYKQTLLLNNLPFEYYFSSGFSIKNLSKIYESEMSDYTIKNTINNMSFEKFTISLKTMFRKYGLKPPVFCSSFPKSKARKIMYPYLFLHTVIDCGRDKNKVLWAKKLLKKQIMRFHKYNKEHNPQFGRVHMKRVKTFNNKKRKYEAVIMDDHVRWDSNYPYIKEDKIIGFGSMNNSMSQDNSSLNNEVLDNIDIEEELNSSDSDDEDDGSIATVMLNTPNMEDNGFSVNHPFELGDIIYPSTPPSLSNSVDDIISEPSSNLNDISMNIIDSDDDLINYLNSNNRSPIRLARNNIITNTIINRIVQIRLLSNTSEPVGLNGYSMINILIYKEMEIIASQLLKQYMENRISDSYSRTISSRILNREFTAVTSEPIRRLEDIITQLENLHNSIEIPSGLMNTDLSNNDLSNNNL